MADPTEFWSAIFMFCSENGRWQAAISSSAYIRMSSHSYRVHTYTHTYIYMSAYTLMYVCVQEYTYVHMHIQKYTYICIQYIHVCTYVHATLHMFKSTLHYKTLTLPSSPALMHMKRYFVSVASSCYKCMCDCMHVHEERA